MKADLQFDRIGRNPGDTVSNIDESSSGVSASVKLATAAVAAVLFGTAGAAETKFNATNLREGRFTYQIAIDGKSIGRSTIEIRRLSGAYRIDFDSKDVQQSWSSTFDAAFRPVAAELHMPGRKIPYHMSLTYGTGVVSGQEIKGEATTPVRANFGGQLVDQRVDWAAMMAAENAVGGVKTVVYDPGTGMSVLEGARQPGEVMQTVLGTQPSIHLNYTILKKDHAEHYLVYATASLPRVMLREDMPNGLVAELVAVEP
jgi:hypothetical protein